MAKRDHCIWGDDCSEDCSDCNYFTQIGGTEVFEYNKYLRENVRDYEEILDELEVNKYGI